jgi:hypothetical protein
LLIIITLVTSRYLNSIKYSSEYNEEYIYNDVGAGEYLPVGANLSKLRVYDINNSKEYEFTKEHNKISVKINDDSNSGNINIPLIYYTGYYAELKKDDGSIEKLNLKENEDNGQIIVTSDNKIKGEVTVNYRMTTIQKITYVISGLSILFVWYKFINCIINKIKQK